MSKRELTDDDVVALLTEVDSKHVPTFDGLIERILWKERIEASAHEGRRRW